MKRLALVAGLFATVSLVLHAQTADMNANIPFDFRMGEKLMPAGEYSIRNNSNGVLYLREESGSHTAAFTLTLPASRRAAPKTGTLEFNRYGEDYFLTKVWTPGAQDGRALPQTKKEKEIASRTGLVQTAGIPTRFK
jgi:hypothetical protein